MKMTYDKEANAVYVYFDEEDTKAARTERGWPFNVDLDGEGNVVGLEIMDADKVLNSEYLSKIPRIDNVE